jgi:hypothetical protein
LDPSVEGRLRHANFLCKLANRFRDTKDLRFGMSLGSARMGDPYRRHRLLLLNATNSKESQPAEITTFFFSRPLIQLTNDDSLVSMAKR